ncbi:ribbon-helix-helix domain-containing protein [Devosia neptuniae]|uniref:ribbon-helix-helix domain-containing protein n=1 Tax=Devosia neptuniae TaxID=191302 RepID=UPI0022AEED85|nr:ribbon-helix-helix domain-containing protein [Devosia neptuniae]MCZ4348173.1 hypothetical protein [Devosia neptuniae]
MAKRANLANALDDVTPAPAMQAVTIETAKAAPIPSREGTALVGAHLPAKYGKAMRLLAAETGSSQRELFLEALDMLFIKKGAKV